MYPATLLLGKYPKGLEGPDPCRPIVPSNMLASLSVQPINAQRIVIAGYTRPKKEEILTHVAT